MMTVVIECKQLSHLACFQHATESWVLGAVSSATPVARVRAEWLVLVYIPGRALAADALDVCVDY